jgi:hypothetical protein
MLTAAMSVVICWGLFGCNRSQQAATPAAVPVAAATAPCNCEPAMPMTAAPVHRHRHHRRAVWNTHAESADFQSYSVESKSHSTYSSSSVREYQPDTDTNVGYAGSAEQYEANANVGSGAVWVDGYGRSHYAADGPPQENNPAALAAEDIHRRMKPWRGYNSDCDQR